MKIYTILIIFIPIRSKNFKGKNLNIVSKVEKIKVTIIFSGVYLILESSF